MIGLDNNPAERAIRRPVVTRKNAYGSRNDDAARLAARIWTVTATAEMAGLNVRPTSPPTSTPAGGTAAGRRPARTWNGSCPGLQLPKTSAPGHSRHPPDNRTETATETASPEYGHAARWHARSRDFRILTRHKRVAPVDDRPALPRLDELLEEENVLLTCLADDLFLIRSPRRTGPRA